MKLLIVILMSFSSIVAFSQGKKSGGKAGFTREYGLAGCGAGSVLMGKRGAQIFAGTTNGTAFNQMFGITSGTLNCVDSASAEVASRIDQFILVNRSQLQGDIARGQGETISALGTYMGCSSGKIGPALKASYSQIFSGDVRANEISDSIISVIMSNPELSQECQNLG
jgi:hypothetical protein